MTPRSVAIGDLNGDNKADLVAANYGSNTVSVLLNDGGGAFAAQTVFAAGSLPRSVIIGDLNGDGRADLAAANASGSTVSVLLQTPAPAPPPPPPPGIITGTPGPERLEGGNGAEIFRALAGSDRITPRGGDDQIEGGPGLDIVLYTLARAAYRVTTEGGPFPVPTRVEGLISEARLADGTDTLSGVERLAFADGVLAFDTGASAGGQASAGEVYRLYQAAFDRVPDLAGLSNNVRVADAGLSLRAEAAAFVVSAEFRTLYGENASDTTFVTALYRNVLDRAPDQAGLNGWLQALSSGQQDRAGVLIGFSESNENRALVANAIQNGILLDSSVLG